MSVNAGDADCTSGMSQRFYSLWTGDARAGFVPVLTNAMKDMIKAQCWAAAQAVKAEVDADQTVVHARCHQGSVAQFLGNGIWTTIQFNTKAEDTHNAVTTGSGWVFIAPRAGVYIVAASLMIESLPVGDVFFDAAVGGITRFRNLFHNSATGYRTINLSFTIRMTAGQTLYFAAMQSTGANTNTSSSEFDTWFTITRIGE